MQPHASYLYAAQAVIGISLVYLAAFLHEDEEGRIQNRLEEWWVRIADAQANALQRVTAFTKSLAKLLLRVLNRLFGDKLISFRLVGASIALTIASVFVFVPLTSFMKSAVHVLPVGRSALTVRIVRLCAWALYPGVVNRRWFSIAWWCISLCLSLPYLSFLLFLNPRMGHGLLVRPLPILILAFLLSLTFDMLYLGVTKAILRHVSERLDVMEIALIILGNLVLLGALLWLPLRMGAWLFTVSPGIGGTLLLSTMFNAIDGFAFSMALGIAALLLLHHLAWSGIERPLYAVARFEPLRRHRKFVFLSGLTLLLMPGASVFTLIRTLLAKL